MNVDKINSDNPYLFQAQRASHAREVALYAKTVPDLQASNRLYDSVTSEQLSNVERSRLADHLATLTPEQEALIKARERLLGQYATELATGHFPDAPTIRAHESTIHVDDDQATVKKIITNPHDNVSPAAKVDGIMLGAIPAEGLAEFEQTRAASFEELAAINDFVPGISLDQLPGDQYEQTVRRYGKKLIDLVVMANRLDIAGDINPGNIMQSDRESTKDFTLVDMEQSRHDERADPALIDNLTEHPDADPDIIREELARYHR